MQYWNSTINKIVLVAIFSSLTFFNTSAQENSPYSRFGIGNTKLIENAAHRGMGGVSIADDNTLITNPTNPASFAGLKLTSFQIGIEGVSINVKNDSLSNRTGSLGLSYVNIGMPITKKLGLSFGLMPQTRAKYGMQQNDSVPGISRVTYDYYGGGGTQKLYVGAAYKFKDFSLGFSTGYMFGNIVNSTEANFTDTLKIISSSVSSRTTMGGVFLQVGALTTQKLNEKYNVTIGGTYTLSHKLNAKKETYWKSFVGDVVSPDYQYDVDSINSLKGKIVIPSKLGLGIMFSEGDYWKIGADLITSNWKKYSAYDVADSTTASWMFKVGGAITPDVNAITQTWKRMTYRAGFYAGQDILRFNETNLPIKGVTLGIGYPIRRTNLSIGQINAALDIGRRGTTNSGLLSEGYTRFTIGFTFNDKWFIPRRYE